MNAAVDRLVGTVFTSATFVERLEQLVKTGADGQDDLRVRLAQESSALSTFESKRAKLVKLYVDSDLPREELDPLRKELDAAIETKRQEVRLLQETLDDASRAGAVDAVRAVLRTAGNFQNWPIEQKRAFVARYFPRITVSRRGNQSVTATPERETGKTTLTLPVCMTWEELQPARTMTDLGLLEDEFYTKKDLAKLGLSYWLLRDRIAKGLLPQPSRYGRGMAWTADQVREMQEHAKDPRCNLLGRHVWTTDEVDAAILHSRRFGKPALTSTDLARVLRQGQGRHHPIPDRVRSYLRLQWTEVDARIAGRTHPRIGPRTRPSVLCASTQCSRVDSTCCERWVLEGNVRPPRRDFDSGPRSSRPYALAPSPRTGRNEARGARFSASATTSRSAP